MKQLRLSATLTIPTDAVTQTFAILGKRGSGKTTTATVLTEELLDAGHHVVVIDPLDVTWGLRSSRDGKSAGYPITVLGGDHADLPLEATAGAVLAEFVVTHHSPVILSLRHFSMADQRRFVTDFCEKLYALKGQTANRVPLHLVIDEADEFAPQRIPSGHERMFGAIDRIVRRGRSAGLGVTLISQRAAVLNKDVLSQAEVLICHQTISPQDRKALDAWIQAHDAHGQAAAFMGSLASLARGEAWIWSPGWLDVFKRVSIRDRRTFDSSATPKAGAVVEQPKRLAPVDLDALRTQIASTIEKAKADDPKALRVEIAGLRKELASKHLAAAPAPAGKRVEVPVLTDADRALLEKLANALNDRAVKSAEILKAAESRADRLVQTAVAEYLNTTRNVTLDVARELEQTLERVGIQKILGKLTTVTPAQPAPSTRKLPVYVPPAPVQKRTAPANGTVHLAGGERKILTALAQYPSGRTKVQVALLCAYAHNGGGFNNYISGLRTKGYLEGSGDNLRITDAGLDALGDFTPLPTGQALAEHWMRQLGKAERLVLDALVTRGPMSKEQAASIAGYEPSGGGFNNALSRLRTLELVQGRGELRASEELFG